MTGYTKLSLVDVCESVRYGYTASAIHESVGPHFLRITDIVPDSINWDSVPYCEIDEVNKDRFSLQQGDIVVARTGATVGYAKLIRDEIDAVFASYLVRFRVDTKVADPGFVGRLVESFVYKDFVKSQVGGAAQPNANAQVLGNFKLQLPTKPEQAMISSILSAYDDLIGNNNRRIKLLEESARLLYQEWFVRLRFPGYEHTRIVEGVPEGWEKRALSAVADVNQKTLKSFDGEIEYIDISSVSTGQINDTTYYDFHRAPSRARRIVRHGDIIWSCVRPNRKSYAVIWQPSPNLIVSTGFAVLTPTGVPASFLYFATTTDAFVGYLTNHARGAAYPAVVAADFERAELVIPPKVALNSFNDFVEPTFSQIYNLSIQNQKLKAARDLLLPRLMSGEIVV